MCIYNHAVVLVALTIARSCLACDAVHSCLQLALAKGQRLGVYGAAVAFGGATYYNGPVIELPTPY